MICPRCNSEISEASIICPVCGDWYAASAQKERVDNLKANTKSIVHESFKSNLFLAMTILMTVAAAAKALTCFSFTAGDALKRGVTDRRFYSRDYVAYLDRGNILVARIEEEDDCEVVVERDEMRSYCGNSVLYYEHTDIDNVNEYRLPSDVALIDESKLQYPLRLRRWREGACSSQGGSNEKWSELP